MVTLVGGEISTMRFTGYLLVYGKETQYEIGVQRWYVLEALLIGSVNGQAFLWISCISMDTASVVQ